MTQQYSSVGKQYYAVDQSFVVNKFLIKNQNRRHDDLRYQLPSGIDSITQ